MSDFWCNQSNLQKEIQGDFILKSQIWRDDFGEKKLIFLKSF